MFEKAQFTEVNEHFEVIFNDELSSADTFSIAS